MSTNTPDDSAGIDSEEGRKDVRERLEEHRETLERLADMDVPASKDAKRALALLEKYEEGQS